MSEQAGIPYTFNYSADTTYPQGNGSMTPGTQKFASMKSLGARVTALQGLSQGLHWKPPPPRSHWNPSIL